MSSTSTSSYWSSQLFDCSKDEESCWWTTWCCCLISGRNAISFDVGSSYLQAMSFIFLVIFVLFLYNYYALLAIMMLIIGLIFNAYYRSIIRTRIREKLNIPDTTCNDFISHCCCPLCSICQEAREARLKTNKKLDFIYGEDLSTLAFPQQINHQQNNYSTHNPITQQPQQHEQHELSSSHNNDTAYAGYNEVVDGLKTISLFSRFILKACLFFSVIILIQLISSDHAQNILILLLVFIQPFVILYFTYWRYHRTHASLDYVIKLFAVGFFMSTTQAIVFESILELVLGIVFAIVLAIVDPNSISNSTDSTSSSATTTTTTTANQDYNVGSSYIPTATGSYKQQLIQFILSVMSNQVPHADTLHSIPYNVDYTSFHHTPSSIHHHHTYNTLTTSLVTNTTAYHNSTLPSDDDYSDDEIGISPELMKRNFLLVIIALFTMAYVVAAGVEETMKHFAVRCCRFPNPLQDPHSVRIYLMTAALGFATSENIEYVFGTKTSPLPGTSLLVGELFVLLLRVLMPIHIICAVLQATSLSKILMGISNSGLLTILLPAIFLHGSFDFFLFLVAAIDKVYEINSIYLVMISYIIPVFITIGGIIWAYIGFQTVIKIFDEGFLPFSSEEILLDL